MNGNKSGNDYRLKLRYQTTFTDYFLYRFLKDTIMNKVFLAS